MEGTDGNDGIEHEGGARDEGLEQNNEKHSNEEYVWRPTPVRELPRDGCYLRDGLSVRWDPGPSQGLYPLG